MLLATVSPDRSCLAETLSTLEFAQRAKYVVNKVRWPGRAEGARVCCLVGVAGSWRHDRTAGSVWPLGDAPLHHHLSAHTPARAAPPQVVAHDEVVEQDSGLGHGAAPPGGASAAHLAATAAELAERDARIAALLRQLDSVAAEAAGQRQEAERRARSLAEQAAASTEAALEAARQQAQALAAASLERQATGVREAAVAQLVEQEWELQQAQGELEAARREVEGARGEAEAARDQLDAARLELEQAWQTQRMLAEVGGGVPAAQPAKARAG